MKTTWKEKEKKKKKRKEKKRREKVLPGFELRPFRVPGERFTTRQRGRFFDFIFKDAYRLFFIAGNISGDKLYYCDSDKQCHPRAKCLFNLCVCQGWHYGDGKYSCEGTKLHGPLFYPSSEWESEGDIGPNGQGEEWRRTLNWCCLIQRAEMINQSFKHESTGSKFDTS